METAGGQKGDREYVSDRARIRDMRGGYYVARELWRLPSCFLGIRLFNGHLNVIYLARRTSVRRLLVGAILLLISATTAAATEPKRVLLGGAHDRW